MLVRKFKKVGRAAKRDQSIITVIVRAGWQLTRLSIQIYQALVIPPTACVKSGGHC